MIYGVIDLDCQILLDDGYFVFWYNTRFSFDVDVFDSTQGSLWLICCMCIQLVNPGPLIHLVYSFISIF